MPNKKRPKKRRTRTKASQKVYTEKQWSEEQDYRDKEASMLRATIGHQKEKALYWRGWTFTMGGLSLLFAVALIVVLYS